jgi:hypothetical protein
VDVPYARVVPAAVKVPDDQAIPNVADPRSRLPLDRIVLLDTAAAVEPEPVDSIPPPAAAAAVVEEWEPGRMRVRLDPAAAGGEYLVVSENYYPYWRAAVDGEPASVLRGDVSLITVPLSAGAREVTLDYRSPAYERGRLITLLSLVVVTGLLAGPAVYRRMRGG